MRLGGSSKFVGVASVSFRFILFLGLLAPTSVHPLEFCRFNEILSLFLKATNVRFSCYCVVYHNVAVEAIMTS